MRALLPLLALSACGAAGDTSTATRNFPAPGGFDAVTLGGPDDVRVVTGGTASISATGRNVDLDKILIELRGTELVVTRKSDGNVMSWFGNGGDRDVTITVTTPAPVKAATLRGSGDLNVDRGASPRFEASLKGSGDLTVVRVTAQTARLALGGSGDIKVGGGARGVEVDLAGSGGIDAEGLNAETATIELRGSGNVDARVSKSAAISIKGSGNVTVRGTGDCTIDQRGSGDARCTP